MGSRPAREAVPIAIAPYSQDDVGSAFEVICALPEYGLTSADGRILRRHAVGIVSRLPAPVIAAELGQRIGMQGALDPGGMFIPPSAP